MADHDFDPERDISNFDELSESSKRMLRAVSARLQLGDEKIPIYLDLNSINSIEIALLTTLDYIDQRLTGHESNWLRERFDASTPTARDILNEDIDKLDEAIKIIRLARSQHPAEIEAKKRIRER